MGEELKKARQPGRSFLWLVLVLSFLLFSLTGWLRLYLSIFDWQLLISLGLFPSPLYLAIYGMVIGLFGVVAAVSLWLGQPWAPRFAWTGVLTAAAWYWLDRLLFTQSASSWTNWPFSAGMTVACLLFVFLVLAGQKQAKFLHTPQVKPGRMGKESMVSHEQDK